MTRRDPLAVVVCFGVLVSLALPIAAGAQTVTFTNASAITIPASGTGAPTGAPAAPYPSNIVVSGLTAPIARVSVTLNGLTHSFPDDVDILLVAPDGAKLIVLSDVGASTDATVAAITLSDEATSFLADTGPLVTGTYRPANFGSGDAFPAPAPAIVAGDSPAPGGIATFASKFAGHSANGTWSLYVVDDLGGDIGSISGGWTLTITQASPATAGQLIISEFRLSGPGGATDEFIEIYNASGSTHVVSAVSGSGYGIAASNGVTRCSIPNGTVIAAGGHFLCVNSGGYSLVGYPAGASALASGDVTYTADIPFNSGIAIFNNNTGGSSYSIANRLDAVGSTSEANLTYKEGSGYPPLTTDTTQSAFTRRPPGGCSGGSTGNCTTSLQYRTTAPVSLNAPADTNDNASDFIFVDVNGSNIGAGQRLGAPGPENMSSPVVRNGTPMLTTRKLEACAGIEEAPNISRDPTSDPANSSQFGTLDIRRIVVNSTPTAITRLRFRVVDLTTYPNPSGAADLRVRSSPGVFVPIHSVNCDDVPSDLPVAGTTLEEPPLQPNEGGYNSSLSVGGGIPAASGGNPGLIAVRFLLGVQAPGVARFCVVPETFPEAIGEPFCYIGSSEGGTIYEPGDFDNDQAADVPLYNRSSGAWTILRSGAAFTSSSAIGLGGAGYTPVPGDYDGDNRLDAAVYQESTGQWTVRTSSSNFARGFSVSWGGPGYKAVPGDYDGDRQTDMAVYYAPTGVWYILLSTFRFTSSMNVSWGGSAYTPIGGQDFDGDGKSDLTTYNESLGTWYVLQSNADFTTALSKGWGGAGYTLVPGDYDGDGKADFAIYNRTTGLWSALKSMTGYTSSLSVSYGGPGYVPMPSDYDGDGKIDIAVYRLQTTQFVALKSSSAYAPGSAIVQTFGTANDVPISSAVLPRSTREIDAGDFDGDFTSDLTIYNGTTGSWSILKSSSSFTAASTIGWGGAGYSPVPGDYDADGRLDLGLYQNATGNWLVLLSASNYTTTLNRSAGGSGYVPVAGDYDGDGKTDLVVYNTTSGLWFGLKSSTGYTTTLAVSWGGTGYTAAPGDFDGDGKQDLALYQASTGNWLILTSSSNYTSSILRNWGGPGYVPVQADHDGDGITDFAVYQTSTGIWTILKSSSGNTIGFTVAYGGPAYTPVAGDWDGDGRADVGVYDTSGNWSILLTGGNYTTSLGKSWGGAGFAPLPVFQ